MNFMQKKSVHMNSIWIFLVKFTCNFSAVFQTAISYMHLPWNSLLMLFSHEFQMKMSLNFTWSTKFTVILKTRNAKKKNQNAFLPFALREMSLTLAPSMERTCRFGLLAATATKCNNWERDSNCQSKNAIFSK